MLTHEELHQLTQFKSKLRRKMNRTIELSLLVNDAVYCNDILNEAEKFAEINGDEELMVSTLTIRNQMGFFNFDVNAAPQPPLSTVQTPAHA
ncbi:hypothetical protein [Aquirhabdus parva]|uniref:Uncharacterized protein n=1 Tax=Aquirhabdus parva TaxID=2283318 RepID=A0A345P4N8_9GAMM|nr:hypothetical protein [Aquirhabdus parva]AXI02247.1 hypothetical protein HYN46_04970 [Aquirhabdus parva]